MKRSVLLVASLWLVSLLAAAAASSAYTLVFRDGSTLIVSDDYRVEGDRVYATLLSGTETFFDKADIDFAKTEAANASAPRRGIVVDQSGSLPAGSDPSQPPSLSDLMRDRRGFDQGIFSKPNEEAPVRMTPAGNVDLFSLPRKPFGSDERSSQIARRLRREGVTAAVLAGSEPDRILLEIVASSKGEVFEALQAVARASVEILAANEDISEVEIAMTSENRSRAGMFRLDAEDAQALADGTVEPGRFFLDHVML